jgi:single cache domain-containing protein
MLRKLSLGALACAAVALAGAALAQAQYGTAAEAKAMLEKLVVAMKADKAKTLALISKGEGGFKDRDLYAVCTGPDGKIAAHPNPDRIGVVQKDNKDVTGKAYGEEITKVAAEGKIAEVSYMFPRLGDKTPVQKVSFVTKVADHICLVGYYK